MQEENRSPRARGSRDRTISATQKLETMSRRTEAVNIAQLVAVLAFARPGPVFTLDIRPTREPKQSMGETSLASPRLQQRCQPAVPAFRPVPPHQAGLDPERRRAHSSGYNGTARLEQRFITLSLTQSNFAEVERSSSASYRRDGVANPE